MFSLSGRIDRAFGEHETLVYGYDDEKEVVFILSMEGSGIFHEVEVPYLRVRIAFNDIQRFYRDTPDELMNGRSWYYPVTRLTLKDNIAWDNSVFDMLSKLDREYEGGIFNREILADAGSISSSTFYCGIDCLPHMSTMIRGMTTEDTADNGERLYKAVLSLRKLYEHRNMICISLNWAVKKLRINNDKLNRTIDEYRKCADYIMRAYLIAIKYSMNRKGHYSKAISEILDNNYNVEKQTLCRIIQMLKKEYSVYLLSGYQTINCNNTDPRDEYFNMIKKEKIDVKF